MQIYQKTVFRIITGGEYQPLQQLAIARICGAVHIVQQACSGHAQTYIALEGMSVYCIAHWLGAKGLVVQAIDSCRSIQYPQNAVATGCRICRVQEQAVVAGNILHQLPQCT